MSRGKKCIVYGLLLALLGFGYMRVNNLFFTMENLYYATERGLIDGPTEKILVTLRENGKTIMVGKWQNHLISVTGKRVFPSLWKRLWYVGPIGEFQEKPLVFHFTDETLYGLSLQEDIATVYVRAFYLVEGDEGKLYEMKDLTMAVDEDDFFIAQYDQAENWRYTDSRMAFAQYVEGYNAAGDVVYTYGQMVDADHYNEL